MAEELEFEDAWQQLVARAWNDPTFKAKLLADPAGVLTANGLKLPKGITVNVVEDTREVLHLVMPSKPAPQELSEKELTQVAGGRQYGEDGDQGPNRDPDRLVGDCDPNN